MQYRMIVRVYILDEDETHEEMVYADHNKVKMKANNQKFECGAKNSI